MTASFFKSLFQWKLNNVIKLNITVTRARQEVGKIEGRFWTLSPFMKKKKKIIIRNGEEGRECTLLQVDKKKLNIFKRIIRKTGIQIENGKHLLL